MVHDFNLKFEPIIYKISGINLPSSLIRYPHPHVVVFCYEACD